VRLIGTQVFRRRDLHAQLGKVEHFKKTRRHERAQLGDVLLSQRIAGLELRFGVSVSLNPVSIVLKCIMRELIGYSVSRRGNRFILSARWNGKAADNRQYDGEASRAQERTCENRFGC